MRWIMLPIGQLVEFADTFRAGRVLFTLTGHSLEVLDKLGLAHASELSALATRYVEVLRTNGVSISHSVSATEYAQLPPWGSNPLGGVIRGLDRSERERILRAVRSARHAVLGSDEIVIRAYDYLEDGLSHEISELNAIYKAIETIEHQFGGDEARTLNTLGVSYKFAKRLVNDHRHDERHAPRPGTPVQPVSSHDVDRAMAVTRKLIEAFVDWRQVPKEPAGN
jgi:hypothetical protein